MLGDALTLAAFGLRDDSAVASVTVDGAPIALEAGEGRVTFSKTAIARELVIETV